MILMGIQCQWISIVPIRLPGVVSAPACTVYIVKSIDFCPVARVVQMLHCRLLRHLDTTIVNNLHSKM